DATLMHVPALVALCMSLYRFFLSSSRAHRDLHSFPTRRSSDLRRPVAGGGDRQLAEVRAEFTAGRGGHQWLHPIHQAEGAVQPRSEEHTSELQSRENLVCRLLLEKKKNIRRIVAMNDEAIEVDS